MNDIITLIDENNQKIDYKLLFIIDKDYKYLIYTKVNNSNIKNDLYAIKVNKLDNNEKTIPITDSEWEMIENEYKKLVK